MMRSVVSAACCWIFVTIAVAQSVGNKDIGLIAKLESYLINWFDQMSRSVDSIADKEDRRRLDNSLRVLQVQIYSVEENGRNLVTTLDKKRLDQFEARKEVSATREALFSLKNGLHKFGLDLRNLSNEYGAGGNDAEKMIAEAIEKRTVWLSDVETEINAGTISKQTVQQGRWILDHQRTASVAIDDLLSKLQKNQ